MNKKDFAKYFAHGILYRILFLVLGIVWVFVFTALVISGAFIGLIIGLGLLVLVVGFVNSIITSFLWFEVKASWRSTFGHGFLLLMALVLVDVIFVTLPSWAFPGIATTVITFIIGSFLCGFAGKKVAEIWKEENQEEAPADISLHAKKLYDRILSDYTMRWEGISGKALLDSNIDAYLKRGLNREEAIRRLAEASENI